MSTVAPAGRLLAWQQLLRAANVFTAASNVIAGFLIVQRGFEPAGALALLLAASACLYLAGMVLNDFFDHAVDAVERPDRPIPSGRISRSDAGTVGWGLLVCGVVAAWVAAWLYGRPMSAMIGSLLAIAVVQYDARLKNTWAGPWAMGWCRTLNGFLGASIAADFSDQPWAWAYAFAIGAYTVGLTYVARSEMIGNVARTLQIRNLVTRLLQGFIVIDAAVAAIAGGWLAGFAVLALLIPTLLLARRAAMT
jgi:4-hydroxybenzoate polyprenyltransferase